MRNSVGARIVCVVWRDAEGDTYEQTVDDALDGRECVVETVGFLLGENDKFLTLAAESLTTRNTVRDVTRVPRGMVLEVVDLIPKQACGNGKRPKK